MEVTDILFGSPPLTIATAKTGTFDNKLLTAPTGANLSVTDNSKWQNGAR